MPTVGSSMKRMSGFAASHLPRLTFCLLPPLRLPTTFGDARASGCRAIAGMPRRAAARRRRRAGGAAPEPLPDRGGDVPLDRMDQEQALVLAVLADVADPPAVQGVGERADARRAPAPRWCRRRRVGADHGAGELGAARADEAVPAEDLATVEREGGAADRRLARPVAHRRGPARDRSARGPAEHRWHGRGRSSSRSTRRARARRPGGAVRRCARRGGRSPNRRSRRPPRACARRRRSRCPASRSAPDGIEERRGFLERDRRGRLVEEQDLRVGRERPGDLDELLLRALSTPTLSRRRDAQPDHLHEGQRVGVDTAPVDQPPGAADDTLEEHVLADREGRHEVALLVDDADAALHRLSRVARCPPARRRGGRCRNPGARPR